MADLPVAVQAEVRAAATAGSPVLVDVRDARSILTRTGGFLEAFTHTLQPYAGCEFSCRYCYVREMMVQRANPHGRAWSTWLAPKRNAAELLSRAARRGALSRARIFMSSATDPYTPTERRMGLTRACLEVLVQHPPEALLLQTRSPIVERDIDLLVQIPRLLVSVSVTTADEAVRRAYEPNAPSFCRRVRTLERLSKAGVRTQAALAPLLPGDLGALAEAVAPWVDRVVVDDLIAGDGAGGRRSRAVLESLARDGFHAFARPGVAERAAPELRRILGDRVAVSREGWNDLSWVAASDR